MTPRVMTRALATYHSRGAPPPWEAPAKGDYERVQDLSRPAAEAAFPHAQR